MGSQRHSNICLVKKWCCCCCQYLYGGKSYSYWMRFNRRCVFVYTIARNIATKSIGSLIANNNALFVCHVSNMHTQTMCIRIKFTQLKLHLGHIQLMVLLVKIDSNRTHRREFNVYVMNINPPMHLWTMTITFVICRWLNICGTCTFSTNSFKNFKFNARQLFFCTQENAFINITKVNSLF